MAFSLDFCQPIEDAVKQLKAKLQYANIVCTNETEINKGAGVKINGTFKGQPVSLVLYFNRSKGLSSKIVVEKFPATDIPKFRSMFDTIVKQEQKVIPIHATITIADQNIRNQIKNELNNAPFTFIAINKTDHMEYSAKIQANGQELTITQFYTGALLIQGTYSTIIDNVVNLIDRIKPLTSEERSLLFVPSEVQGELRGEIAKKSVLIDEQIVNRTEKDDGWENFLFQNDFKTLTTGETLIEILEQQTKNLPEYNFLVAIFAKVFEGFLIKVLIKKDFFTLEQYNKEPDIADIGNVLRKGKLKKYIRDERRHGFIIEKLISVWEGARCKEMHSDPAENMQILSVSSLDIAKDKIGGIKSCIKEAFDILIKFGYTDADLTATDTKQHIAMSSQIESTPPKMYSTPDESTKLIPSNLEMGGYIGTDESGKGDYFGPLVIAGVYLDPITEKRLTSAGVRDSKKISDVRIFEYAKMIRKYLNPKQYTVITIGPEKYNELYRKIGNLNKLLAWGHARAIENILAGVQCNKAIADQFGDESFIQGALMSGGKKIELIQMPKAEQFTAVAAASILAREGFLIKLAELGKPLRMELLKGASPQVEETARIIIKRDGFDALNKLVKLHFKTTEKLR